MNKTVIINVPSNDATIVAMHSATDNRVVAQGKNMRAVLNRAAKAGVKNPMLMFVPRSGVRYVF